MTAFTGKAAGYRVDLVDGQVRVVDIDSSNGDTGTQIIVGDTTLEFADRSYVLGARKGMSIETPADGQLEASLVTGLAGGGYVITWAEKGLDDDAYFLYAQRYDASGNKLGEASAAFDFGDWVGLEPYSVASLTDGGYVISWQTGANDQDIHAQRFDALGNKVGAETVVNTHTEGSQWNPSVVGLADGAYVIAWASNAADGGIYAQRFDAAGNAVGNETRIDSASSLYPRMAEVAALASGGYVISWESYGQDGNAGGLYAQCFDAAGNPVKQEFRINTSKAGHQFGASIAALDGGGFVVTWTTPDSAGPHAYAQRFDDSGHKLGNQVRVGEAHNTSEQSFNAVAALKNGGYVISWVNENEDGMNIHAQRYDHKGHKIGHEITVDFLASGALNHDPAIAGTSDGGFTITWTQLPAYGVSEVFSRHFDASGKSDTTLEAVLSGTDKADVINGGTGVQRIHGENGNDTLNGGDGTDYLYGGNGQDLMHGDAGDDSLWGGEGVNSLYGDDGNDVLVGGADGDYLDGGAGNDILNSGWAGSGKLFGGSGDDRLTGGREADLLCGGSGADVLKGGDGPDIFRFDTALSASNIDVIVDFSGPNFDRGDRIQLENDIFTQLNATGKLAEQFFAYGSEAGDADDYIIYDGRTGQLFYDADGNGAGTQVQFAVVKINGFVGLSASDFFVI